MRADKPKWVCYYKREQVATGMTYKEALEKALSFGYEEDLLSLRIAGSGYWSGNLEVIINEFPETAPLRDPIRSEATRKTNPNRICRGKLTEKEVRAIRAVAATGKYTQAEIAKKYGMTAGAIGNIVARRSWHHID